MTYFEYDLAFRAVIGLAGCAMALVALAFDWRETDYRALHWYERSGDPTTASGGYFVEEPKA